MDTDRFETELEAYLDGELDARAKAAVEEQVATDPQAAALVAARRALRHTLRAELALQAPEHLRATILATIGEAAATRHRRSLVLRARERGRTAVAALLPPRRLVPALATAAAVLFLLARRADFAPSTVENAFAEPAAVIVLRYGEGEPGAIVPELGGVVIGGPQ